jgi:hypothetical protein
MPEEVLRTEISGRSRIHYVSDSNHTDRGYLVLERAKDVIEPDRIRQYCQQWRGVRLGGITYIGNAASDSRWGHLFTVAEGGALTVQELKVTDGVPFLDHAMAMRVAEGSEYLTRLAKLERELRKATTDRQGRKPPLVHAAAENPVTRFEPIQFSVGTDRVGDLAIFDIGGRLIRQLPVTAGGAVWDQRDRAGDRVPNGIYFIRAEGALDDESARIVLVR